MPSPAGDSAALRQHCNVLIICLINFISYFNKITVLFYCENIAELFILICKKVAYLNSNNSLINNYADMFTIVWSFTITGRVFKVGTAHPTKKQQVIQCRVGCACAHRKYETPNYSYGRKLKNVFEINYYKRILEND